jgi:ABC-2 type transport system permease protein
MQAFLTLVRREIGGYFTSFTGYTVLAVVLLLIGLSFYSIVDSLNGSPTPIPVTELYYNTVYFWLILLLSAPVITMRSFAQEKDSGTFETLMTAPVSDRQVVGSKFVGSMIFYGIIWLPLLACTLILRSFIDVGAAFDFGLLVSTGLGILLIGFVYMSMGVFASSLTRSQVTAAMISFALGVSLFMMSFLGADLAGPDTLLHQTIKVINLKQYMQNFAAGIIDTRPVVFCLSVTALFLFLTLRVVESRRWK